MDRRMINLLTVDDNDLECHCDTLTLDEISLGKLSFTMADLEKFDVIYYSGKKGDKILKSNCIKPGKIV